MSIEFRIVDELNEREEEEVVMLKDQIRFDFVKNLPVIRL